LDFFLCSYVDWYRTKYHSKFMFWLIFSEGFRFASRCSACYFAPILTSLCWCESHRARDTSPLCLPSLYLNLIHPYRPSCTHSTLISAHPFCLGYTISRSRDYRERQLLARRIQGSQNGLRGARDRPLVPRWTPRLIILILYINAIIEIKLEFCLIIYSWFYSLL